jgi:hypothetical protein
MGRLVGRLGAGQRHQSCHGFAGNRRFARLARPVVQQAFDPGLGKALLPPPPVGRLTPTVRATVCAGRRSAEASTIRARSTCLRGRLRSATIAASRSRSAALTTTHTL